MADTNERGVPDAEQGIGKLFKERIAKLEGALDPENENEHRFEAIETYVRFFEDNRHGLKKPGASAEMDALLRHFFPLPHSLTSTEGTPSVDGKASRVDVLRTLFRDLSAYWIGCFSGDGLDTGRYFQYYNDWKKLVADAQLTPYKRLANYDCDALLKADSIENTTKRSILRLIADALALRKWDPRDKLGDTANHRVPASPEVILNLQLWESLGRPAADLEAPLAAEGRSVEDVLLYWAAQDTFLSELLYEWGWLRRFEFKQGAGQPIEMPKFAERVIVLEPTERKEDDGLSRGTRLPVGGRNSASGEPEHSSAERWTPLEEQSDEAEDDQVADRWTERLLNDPYIYDFKPLTFVQFGQSAIGKTHFLMAYINGRMEASGAEQDHAFAAKRELQKYYQDHVTDWHNGQHSSTTDRNDFEFELAGVPFRTFDYMGEWAEMNGTVDAHLKALLREAKGLLFFFDSRHFADAGASITAEGKLTREWYRDIIRDVMPENRRGMPVAILINKIDEILGDSVVASLSRKDDVSGRLVQQPELIPPSLDPHSIRVGTGAAGEPGSPFERLCHVLAYNPVCSRTVPLQSFVRGLVTNFHNLLEDVQDYTDSYQIYFTAAISHKQKPLNLRKYYPFGVRNVVDWITGQLAGHFRPQGLELARRDRDTMRGQETSIVNEIARAHTCIAQIEQAQVDSARENKRRFARKRHIESLGQKIEEQGKSFFSHLKEAARLADAEIEVDEAKPLGSTYDDFLHRIHGARPWLDLSAHMRVRGQGHLLTSREIAPHKKIEKRERRLRESASRGRGVV